MVIAFVNLGGMATVYERRVALLDKSGFYPQLILLVLVSFFYLTFWEVGLAIVGLFFQFLLGGTQLFNAARWGLCHQRPFQQTYFFVGLAYTLFLVMGSWSIWGFPLLDYGLQDKWWWTGLFLLVPNIMATIYLHQLWKSPPDLSLQVLSALELDDPLLDEGMEQ